MVTLFIISCSVAADATAVAIAAAVRGVTTKRAISMALSFGFAQALMSGLGWFGGAAVGAIWERWDHWIALVLLAGVGLKMIKEAFSDEREAAASLLILSIATSIDALAVGVSLPTLGVTAFVSLAMIGVVTFLFSAAGAFFGRFLGQRFGRAMEVLGGLALVGIGISIVIQHTA